MAEIELTQATLPQNLNGERLPLIHLPEVAHSKLAFDAAAVELEDETRVIQVRADADARLKVARSEAGAAPDQNSILLKAGELREFEVDPGCWIKVTADV